MSDTESIATVMNAETFANLSKPKSVTAKHFQYMTVAHWLISRMQQSIEFSPEQIASMEKSMGFNCNASEISAIYNEFAVVQSDVSKEVSKRLTLTFHENKKASKRVKKVAAEVVSEVSSEDGVVVSETTKPKRKYGKKQPVEVDASQDATEVPAEVATEPTAKPKRKYTKKQTTEVDASQVATEVPAEVPAEPIANTKPKRKPAKKSSVTADAPVITEVVNEVLSEVENNASTQVDPEPVAVVATEPVVDEITAKPIKKRVAKKESKQMTDSESEANGAAEPKKRASKKKEPVKPSVAESTIKTLNAFEEILTSMESEENMFVESELQVESYQ